MATVTGFDPDDVDQDQDQGDDNQDQDQGDDMTEAPYGYLKDGVTPRKSPAGRPPKSAAGGRPRGKRAAARKRPPTRRPATRPATSVNYADGIEQFLGLGALVLRRVSPVDSITLTYYAPTLAEPLAEAIEEMPGLAAWADRILRFGPHGKLAAALIEFGAQIAANHGVVPVGEFGTKPPHVLARETFIRTVMRREKVTRAQAEAMADQAEADQAAAMRAAMAAQDQAQADHSASA